MNVVPLKRTRAETCLSDFALDRLLAEELPPAEARGVRKHLFGCLECTARLEALKRGRDAFLADPDRRLSLVAPVERPRAPRRVWLFRLAGGAIAAGALLFGLSSLPFGQGETGTRRKGGGRLGFYVKHETEVRRGASGEVVRPGDALRFTYSLDRPAHLAIIGVDAEEKASVYFPDGQVTEALPSGRDVALPLAALLDDTLGRETIYGLFCEAPLSVEPARAAFERGERSAPEGCELERVTIEKR